MSKEATARSAISAERAMKLAQNMERLKPFVGGLGNAILRELTQDAFALASEAKEQPRAFGALAQQEPDWLDKEQAETDWDHVWLLIKAASYASSRGFISGTTNWGSAVSRYMRNKSPQPAQQEPVVWRYKDARGHYRYRGFVADFDKEYPMLKPQALYTTPQAQRKPLTDEWIRSRCGQTWVFETAKQWIRLAEAAHGINAKGGAA